MRRLPLAAALALTAALSLPGCVALGDPTPQTPQESETTVTADRNAPTEAVLALGGRIVDALVRPISAGLGRGVVIEFEVSSTDPVSVDELRDVVRAARDASSFDPDTFSVVAYVVDGTGRTAVDTWTAGGELFGAGDYPGGIAMTELQVTDVLGPWAGSR